MSNNNFTVSSSQPQCVPANLSDCKIDHWSPVAEYRNRIKSAKQELATRMKDAFQCLDELNEAEFMDVVKTMTNDGVSACDMLEKFRKWKGL